MNAKNDKAAFIKDFSEKVVDVLVRDKHMPREKAEKLAGALVPQAFDDGKSDFFFNKAKLRAKLVKGTLLGMTGVCGVPVALHVIRGQLELLPFDAGVAMVGMGAIPLMVDSVAGDRLRDHKKRFEGNDKGNRKIRRLGYAALREELKKVDVEIPKKPKKLLKESKAATFSKQ